jgi:hypothetical protein
MLLFAGCSVLSTAACRVCASRNSDRHPATKVLDQTNTQEQTGKCTLACTGISLSSGCAVAAISTSTTLSAGQFVVVAATCTRVCADTGYNLQVYIPAITLEQCNASAPACCLSLLSCCSCCRHPGTCCGTGFCAACHQNRVAMQRLQDLMYHTDTSHHKLCTNQLACWAPRISVQLRLVAGCPGTCWRTGLCSMSA